ncbi:hypothetical protein AVEN_110461-1 [Araneus ventricosus]|uniref:Uncharacterized protein n=1 Tax=Araneus ventricosus TaxID=182803 RepID=A0A4Y2I512_ARAVE|nr:hypothetical protein AVEN_189540-1 [Araneus ventricosus]GBM72674.1 hypothetical protein AVEN_228005-1 [Araneus ventricosus]GBM72683.1 hypothetical protein AVEN_272924-1 [Araneus ventricosus]GBM72702.1 hypothetical protein AVEN_110461-1 [Araneus ventricosus]
MSLKSSPLSIIQPSNPHYGEDLLNEKGSDFSCENNCTEDFFLVKVHIRLILNYLNLKNNGKETLNLLHVEIIIIEEIVLSKHSETKRTITTTAYNIIQLPDLVNGYFL